MNTERAQKIRTAVDAAIKRWPEYRATLVEEERPAERRADVVHHMPRRSPVHNMDTQHVTLPMLRRVTFRPGIIRPAIRLLVWAWAIAIFLLGNLRDVVLGRSSIGRRAERLRRVFEETGASFIKLGQQLSLRADLLPYPYCVELSKMLDQVKPFPTKDAIAIVERSLRRPLREVFAEFDPEPIGSGSIACVYQARLRTGEPVAVKVRRPQIGLTLAADLRALDWLLVSAEALTIIRPGSTGQLRHDLRLMLFGELNFRNEARYTEMFRQRAYKSGGNITAPCVYFEHCSDEVLVTELVSGVWIWELMAAVDSNDTVFLQKMRAMRIEPKSLARTLTRAVHREMLEELFFHADPHPANLVVLPDNRVCFIDFGAVGRFSTKTRNTYRELHFHMKNGDVGRMVSAAVGLFGSLPPIDVDRLTDAMEEIYTDWLYAIKSPNSEWWERSNAQTWLRCINVARKFGLPVRLETIQFFRATLLYDSIVTRLNREIDFSKEWEHYARRAAKDARKRVKKQIRKRMFGPTNMDYLRIEQVADTVNQSLFRLQHTVEGPVKHFRNIVGKLAYGFSIVLRLASVAIVVGCGALIVDFVARRWFGRPITWTQVWEAVTSLGLLQLGALIVAFLLVRRMLIRTNDPDTNYHESR
jgi:ubiquinone biosynthesis protein